MRTTIRIDEQLLIQAKKLAAERGITFSALIGDTLRETIRRHKPPARRAKVRLTTTGRGRVRPNVDLDGTASLLNLMEARDGADSSAV